jgi:hypothetical protein
VFKLAMREVRSSQIECCEPPADRLSAVWSGTSDRGHARILVERAVEQLLHLVGPRIRPARRSAVNAQLFTLPSQAPKQCSQLVWPSSINQEHVQQVEGS